MESDLDSNLSALRFASEASLIFWDFDGVIKDSVGVKSMAFESLFLSYGKEIAVRVRHHHEANGGMSRFDKIPIYLRWAGESVTEPKIKEFCNRFSGLALQAVIDSRWVPGVREFLVERCAEKYFVLVTATPQEEIQQILEMLDISDCFREIHGAPKRKSAAIRDVLYRLNCDSERALVIGDADTDLVAAQDNAVPFLLRRTLHNRALQSRYTGPMFDNLPHE